MIFVRWLRPAPLVAALCLAGCANWDGLVPSGKLADGSALKTDQTVAGITLSPSAWPRSDWWTRFGDSQLDGLIDEALRSSPDLELANARARQAQAVAEQYDADRGPNVQGNASITRSRLSRREDPTGQGDRLGTLRGLSAGFAYTFDLWGGKRAAWESALGQARAAEIDRQAARLTVSANIARAYSALAYAYALQDVSREDVSRTQRMLELSQQRFDAGLDSQYQLQQTQSLAAAATSQATAAEQAVAEARIELAALLGQGPDRGLTLARPQRLKPASLTLPAQLPADLLGRRPDIVANRWRVEAASRGIDASKANFYPNIDLTANLGVQALLGDALFGAPSRFWNIGPALSLPIFDSGRRRADLAGRDADYDVAVAQYNQTVTRALADVSQAITRLRSLDQQISEQQRARDIARDSYDLAMQRYGSGIGNYLDALTIEQQLLQADRTLADLQQNQIDTSVLLVQALGGGFHADATAGAMIENAE
ncbi:efflux transporter outer membrane subunit [Pseudomonas sp. Marseille-QA0892]